MCYEQAVNYYVGREVTPGVDYLLRDDGNGIYVSFWDIADIIQPSIDIINSIVNNISFAVQFDELREFVTQEQLKAQQKQVLLANKFVLDCSDKTKTLLLDARTALEGAGKFKTTLIDYQGTPNDITLDDIDVILGNKEKAIEGEFPKIRLWLHEREIEILKNALLGEPYEVDFNIPSEILQSYLSS